MTFQIPDKDKLGQFSIAGLQDLRSQAKRVRVEVENTGAALGRVLSRRSQRGREESDSRWRLPTVSA